MQLVVVRHGPAGTPEADPEIDRVRPLTPKGKRRTRRAMKGIAALCPELKLIVTSPLTRATETAELLKKAVKDADLREDERLGPDGDWVSLVAELEASVTEGEAAAVVGHDPQLSGLVASLCTNHGADGFVALDKGGAAALGHSDSWQLLWLATREQLERVK